MTIPTDRPTAYYRRKAAQWLKNAADFRRRAATDPAPFGRRACIDMATIAIEAAATNRRALDAKEA